MATETRSRKFPDALLRDWESNDWNNWNFGTLGTDVSLIRLERSEAVERLERAAALRGAERLNSWSDLELAFGLCESAARRKFTLNF